MKIGIMTMHRVQNVGSVLQAYALQHKIQQFGYDAELIDYVFPQEKKKSFSPKGILSWGWEVLNGFPSKRKKEKLDLFRKQFLKCSVQTYCTREDLRTFPPEYDIYCTGSDQVWNPRHIGFDTSFMFDFAPSDARCIAYASSFASKDIEEPFFSLYAKQLSKYKHITVREQSGVEIIRRMTGKEASVTCDPTILLSADDWQYIADASDLQMPKRYILVYLLRYMFDPRPGFYNIVEKVRTSLGLPVFYFNPYTNDGLQPHIKHLRGMGPTDFVCLVKNASFVITDSFHGTAFATIFNKPMIGVVKNANAGDGRILTLRKRVNGLQSVVGCNDNFCFGSDNLRRYQCEKEAVDSFRRDSENVLHNMILS